MLRICNRFFGGFCSVASLMRMCEKRAGNGFGNRRLRQRYAKKRIKQMDRSLKIHEFASNPRICIRFIRFRIRCQPGFIASQTNPLSLPPIASQRLAQLNSCYDRNSTGIQTRNTFFFLNSAFQIQIANYPVLDMADSLVIKS